MYKIQGGGHAAAARPGPARPEEGAAAPKI